ncbi:MAG TPA: RNA 2',3'-cyclic phosphodiesterase [Terracidiphilus sp.]|nr:RNA 2',3'-cyclic phosphodiesterase [Terracidiphilus sp.]
MRLFLAIPLAESVAAELARLTSRLRSAAPDLRWSAPDSWHITLQFLGETTPAQYECLIPRLAGLRSPPFLVRLAQPGLFDRAAILHLGVEPTPQLLELQQRIVAETTPCGFEPESRPYHPHITLARSKSRSRNLHSLAARLPGQGSLTAFTAREFLLYESHLSSSGSTYEVRHRFPLEPR